MQGVTHLSGTKNHLAHCEKAGMKHPSTSASLGKILSGHSRMAGEAPRRGAFCIARWSEGRSPDDPGKA